ncbi:IclR family transcriptional regulator [bacterium]|nr:IclR family transcriptional regulator [bacterium]
MVQSVEKALRLLNVVAAREEPLGVRELARLTDLHPATAQGLLATLRGMDYVQLDESTKRYSVGSAALHLGSSQSESDRLAALVHPVLDSLFSRFGETVAALAEIAGTIHVVDWIQTRQSLAVIHRPGPVEAPHYMASGAVVLAYRDAAAQKAYARSVDLAKYGPNLPTTQASLLKELREIRTAGWAERENAGNSGVAAWAAPVLDGRGRLVVAIGCSCPLARLNATLRTKLARSVKQAARDLSETLGH